jgi:hypothetical protein
MAVFFLLIVSSWHVFGQVLFGQCGGEDFGKAEGSCSNKLHWLFGSHQCYTGSMLSHNYTILWCTQPQGEDIEVGDLEDQVSELEQTLYSIQKQHFRWPYVIGWVAEVIFCNKLSPWSWFDCGGAEFVRPEGTGDATATNWCFWGLWVCSTPWSAGWEIQTLWVLHRSCGSLTNICACSQFVTFLLLGNNSLELFGGYTRVNQFSLFFPIITGKLLFLLTELLNIIVHKILLMHYCCLGIIDPVLMEKAIINSVSLHSFL